MKEMVDPSKVNNFWNEMDASDFKVPRCVLGHRGPTAGMFVFNTGASFKDLTGCYLIAPKKTRVLYDTSPTKRRCASDDFMVPSNRIENPVAKNCLACPLSSWDESEFKDQMAKECEARNYRPKQPLCTETHNVLMGSDQIPLFFMQWQKTQIKIVNEKLFSHIRLFYPGVFASLVKFDMKLEYLERGNNSWYSTVFGNFNKVEDEAEAKKLVGLYNEWKDRAGQVLSQQHDDMAAKNETDAPF